MNKRNYIFDFKNSNKRNKNFYKRYIFILIFFLIFSLSIFVPVKTFSYDEGSSSAEETLSNNVFNQLNDLDLSQVEQVLDNISINSAIFGEGSFREKIEEIVNGNFFGDYSSFFSAIIGEVGEKITKYLPLIFTILGLSLLNLFVTSFKSGSNEGLQNIIYFVTFAVVIVILGFNFKSIIESCNNTLLGIKSQIDAIMPIMLTLLTAIGGTTSVGIYKPIVAVLSGSITTIFSSFVYPLFILSFILIVVGNLTSSIKLNKFIDLIFSIFKWVIGFVFTLFSAFLTFQGITAGRYDGISVSATKFAIKSYIPIIGGYLSDGLDFIVLSSVLIKNAIGVAGLIIIAITIISPIIELLILKFSLQFLSAILETLGDDRISNLITKCSKILLFPIVILLAVSFMYLLIMSLIMATANII